MRSIYDFQKKYASKLDHLDLELLLAQAAGKTREFILAHPEQLLTARQAEKFESLAKRRLKNEPLAYILGRKEFYGLNFEVTPATLVPRWETEMLVDEALGLLRNMLTPWSRSDFTGLRNKIVVIDVGTGSGNIITSIAKAADLKFEIIDLNLFGLDISQEALRVAKRNARRHNVYKKIKFINGNLIDPIIKNLKLLASRRQAVSASRSGKNKNPEMIILANLPYLSKEIYFATEPDVKKFEPKSALYSPKQGLHHYEELLKQIKGLKANGQRLKAILEISPEQRLLLQKLIKKYFAGAKIEFKKDLAGRTRIAIINI